MTEPDASASSGLDADDEAATRAQLGRPTRGARAVGHRCPCGRPDVVTTEPRLPGGAPFPTTYYLTCPRAASLIGTLEGSGLMKQMQARLADDDELAAVLDRVVARELDPASAASAVLTRGGFDAADAAR